MCTSSLKTPPCSTKQENLLCSILLPPHQWSPAALTAEFARQYSLYRFQVCSLLTVTSGRSNHLRIQDPGRPQRHSRRQLTECLAYSILINMARVRVCEEPVDVAWLGLPLSAL